MSSGRGFVRRFCALRSSVANEGDYGTLLLLLLLLLRLRSDSPEVFSLNAALHCRLCQRMAIPKVVLVNE